MVKIRAVLIFAVVAGLAGLSAARAEGLDAEQAQAAAIVRRTKATALFQKADQHYRQEEFLKAEKAYVAALSVYGRVKFPGAQGNEGLLRVADCLNNLAHSRFKLGILKDAEVDYLDALRALKLIDKAERYDELSAGRIRSRAREGLQEVLAVEAGPPPIQLPSR